jgi:hypothetical protein
MTLTANELLEDLDIKDEWDSPYVDGFNVNIYDHTHKDEPRKVLGITHKSGTCSIQFLLHDPGEIAVEAITAALSNLIVYLGAPDTSHIDMSQPLVEGINEVQNYDDGEFFLQTTSRKKLSDTKLRSHFRAIRQQMKPTSLVTSTMSRR